ncbi:hypothetical protein AB0D78_41020 [Streptomyces avermitilis]
MVDEAPPPALQELINTVGPDDVQKLRPAPTGEQVTVVLPGEAPVAAPVMAPDTGR